jgi:hypothetical protein
MFEPDRKPEPADDAKFFEYGYVVLQARDFKTRQASLEICIPNTLLQAVTPSLLGSGWLDKFRVRDPIAVWIPQLTPERFNVAATGHDIPHTRANRALKQWTEEIIQVFQKVAQFLNDPSDIVPFLPMGTYVLIRFRCRVDDIPKILEGIDKTPVVGIDKFQWAMATVLATVCLDFQSYENALKPV